jgi:hypothetical protein
MKFTVTLTRRKVERLQMTLLNLMKHELLVAERLRISPGSVWVKMKDVELMLALINLTLRQFDDTTELLSEKLVQAPENVDALVIGKNGRSRTTHPRTSRPDLKTRRTSKKLKVEGAGD